MKLNQADALEYPVNSLRTITKSNRFPNLSKTIKKHAKSMIQSYNMLVPADVQIKSKNDFLYTIAAFSVAIGLIFPPVLALAVIALWRTI